MHGRLVIITDNHKIPRKYRGPGFRFRATSFKPGTVMSSTHTFQLCPEKESKKKFSKIDVYEQYKRPRDTVWSWRWVGDFSVETNLVRFKSDRAIKRDYDPEKLDRQHESKGESN